MPLPDEQSASLWPLVVYGGAVVCVVAVMLAASHLLGERHRERRTDEPYESGISATGTARMRFDIKFYLVAVFFVIFDLEAAFIYVWALSVREAGWAGFVEMAIFIGVLLAGLAYLWRLGALEWGRGNGAKAKINSALTRTGEQVCGNDISREDAKNGVKTGLLFFAALRLSGLWLLRETAFAFNVLYDLRC